MGGNELKLTVITTATKNIFLWLKMCHISDCKTYQATTKSGSSPNRLHETGLVLFLEQKRMERNKVKIIFLIIALFMPPYLCFPQPNSEIDNGPQCKDFEETGYR